MKRKVVVFGGCGFIGRNLVEYLIRENVALEVCVVDKIPPQTAWLSETHKAIFDNPRVSFKSANLINPDACRAALLREDGEKWDWAINCAGETRYGQSDGVYEEGILKLSVNCARQSAAAGVTAFLEISACMANNKRTPHKENDVIEPVTKISRLKARVEEELGKIEGIHRAILRPGVVYGSSDKYKIMSFLILGAIYKHLNERLKLLWSAGVRLNTVHVKDVCRAVGFVLLRAGKPTDIDVYNVVDDSDTTLGSICEMVGKIFGIEISFGSNIVYDLAKLDLTSVAEDANEKHLLPWAKLCAANGIENTPLSPYIAPDTLTKNHTHLDGSKLKSLGFQYEIPQLTAESLLMVLREYADMNLFPKTSLP